MCSEWMKIFMALSGEYAKRCGFYWLGVGVISIRRWTKRSINFVQGQIFNGGLSLFLDGLVFVLLHRSPTRGIFSLTHSL